MKYNYEFYSMQRQFPRLELEALEGKYAQFPRELEWVLALRYPDKPQDQPVHIPCLYCTFLLHVIAFFSNAVLRHDINGLSKTIVTLPSLVSIIIQ